MVPCFTFLNLSYDTKPYAVHTAYGKRILSGIFLFLFSRTFFLFQLFYLALSSEHFKCFIIFNIILCALFFQIIRERLPDYPIRNGLIWNNAPGALLTIPTFADSSLKMPFFLDILNKEPGHNFTAVIFVQVGVTLTPSAALYRLVKTITRSQYVARVSVWNMQWNCIRNLIFH